MKKSLICTVLSSVLTATSAPAWADDYQEKDHIDCASTFIFMSQSISDPGASAVAGEYAIKAMSAAEAFIAVDAIHAGVKAGVPAIHQALEDGKQTFEQLLEKARACIAVYDAFDALGLQ